MLPGALTLGEENVPRSGLHSSPRTGFLVHPASSQGSFLCHLSLYPFWIGQWNSYPPNIFFSRLSLLRRMGTLKGWFFCVCFVLFCSFWTISVPLKPGWWATFACTTPENTFVGFQMMWFASIPLNKFFLITFTGAYQIIVGDALCSYQPFCLPERPS